MLDYRRIFRLRLGRRAKLRRELEEEIRTHLELRAEELVAKGMPPEEAQAGAQRRFGDPAAAGHELYASARRREARLKWGRLLDGGARDVRLGFRRMLRAPGYTTVSISIVALGIALTSVERVNVDDERRLTPYSIGASERVSTKWIARASPRTNGQS